MSESRRLMACGFLYGRPLRGGEKISKRLATGNN
jgi:hypothetical protein